jgi:hypothetical protein
MAGPDDSMEREADRAAGEVISRRPATPVVSPTGSATPSGAPEAPSVVEDVLASPGEPLAAGTRRYFEQGFGHDFSRVRIHADRRADESAQMIDASAYAVGDDLVFARNACAPGGAPPPHLLAHELAHVVQQGPAPVLRRQTKDQKDDTKPAGAIRPLVKKVIDKTATPEEKAQVGKMAAAGQLSEAETQALQNAFQDAFRASLQKALAPILPQKEGIQVTIGGPTQSVHRYYKARLRLRLSGALKVVGAGMEGTVETTAEVTGDADKKTVEIVITPPEGKTALAENLRAKAFPDGPLIFNLGETALKVLNMVSLQGEITVVLTGSGNKSAGGGLVLQSPKIPDDVVIEATFSQSAEKPTVAPATGSPALPPPRAFATAGVAGTPGQTTGAAATVGVDFPLATDTKNPLIYGGVGARLGVDTQGDVTGGVVGFTGAHLSPLTLQIAGGGGVERVPGQPGTGGGAKAVPYFGAEASVGVQVLKRVEIMALVSAIQAKDQPAESSVQLGVGVTF